MSFEALKQLFILWLHVSNRRNIECNAAAKSFIMISFLTDFDKWFIKKKHLKLKSGFYQNPFKEGTYHVTFDELKKLYYDNAKRNEKKDKQ